jgi:sialate O-acetylesterase
MGAPIRSSCLQRSLLLLAALIVWACDAPDVRPAEPAAGASALRVATVFGDSMVLQRDRALPVWGRANPGERVTVRFGEQSHDARAGDDGRWQLWLRALPASAEPRSLVVASDAGRTLRFEDVLVGDVYLAGGQSNMAIGLAESAGGPPELRRADHPTIRFLRVPLRMSPARPAGDFDAHWEVCTPQTAGDFSAVAYWFARRFHAETGVPVGIVQAAQGNSWAESWTPRAALESSEAGRAYLQAWDGAAARFDPEVAKTNDARRLEVYREKVAVLRAKGRKVNPYRLRPPRATVPPRSHLGWPGTLYNGTIAPLEPFALRGVLWYQGERNARVRGWAYREVLTTLIESWRRGFESPELPFFIVQLADWDRPAKRPRESAIAEAREAQLRVHRSVPHTGLVVAIDTGERGATHPRNKRLPGERLALWALAAEPGVEVEASGPIFESQRIDADRVALTFHHATGGLMVGRRSGPATVTPADEPLASFAIAGADRVFQPAEAEIRGDEVVVWSAAVPAPLAVRYAWADNPLGANLYNRAGLPASPFRSDDWPVSTEGVLAPKLPVGHRSAPPLPIAD